MTDFLDTLNAQIERAQASDREVARLTGQSVAGLDADTTAPDTDNRELQTLIWHDDANQPHSLVTTIQNARTIADDYVRGEYHQPDGTIEPVVLVHPNTWRFI